MHPRQVHRFTPKKTKQQFWMVIKRLALLGVTGARLPKFGEGGWDGEGVRGIGRKNLISGKDNEANGVNVLLPLAFARVY
jgi:hypothetical protein